MWSINERLGQLISLNNSEIKIAGTDMSKLTDAWIDDALVIGNIEAVEYEEEEEQLQDDVQAIQEMMKNGY